MPPVSADATFNSEQRPEAGGSSLTLPQLAHELNSLLDGAMRCLGLAARGLEESDTAQHVRGDVKLAGDGLARMSVLLERAMRGGTPRISVLRDEQPLGKTVQRVLALCHPLADERGVTLNSTLGASAAELSTGLLEPVLFNGLRNAIDAAACSPPGDRHVDLSVMVQPTGGLEVCIADTGPGVGAVPASPTAHGLGLDLCHEIARELGGTVELIATPYGRGTVMCVRLPLEGNRGDER